MKTIILPGLIFVLMSGVGIIMIARTHTKVPIITDISLMRDITEKHSEKPDTNEILNEFDLATNPFNGANFNFSVLSDVSYNQTRQVKLPVAEEWLTNEFDRQRDIQRFNDSIVGILNDPQYDETGKRHSSIYVPIARELNRLSESKSQRRILIIYSDLMQNETSVSLYRQREFNLAQSDPDSLKNILDREVSLARLDGIEVHLIYQPANATADINFRVVSEFYKNLLESKGAKVFIEANIQS